MNNKVDMSWLLQQIAAIQSDTEYLKEGLAQLAQMGVGDSGESYSPGNILGKAKADALGSMIQGREITNQQLLVLYEKMYDDCVQGHRRQVEAEFIAKAVSCVPAAEETGTSES